MTKNKLPSGASEQALLAASPVEANQSTDDLVDADDACAILGGRKSPIHVATLYRGVKSGRYPPPIKVAPNTNRWKVGELNAALKRLAAERSVSVSQE